VQTQIQVMLDLQNAMNTRVHSDWRQQGFEWYRAIWIECAELMDHYGWKWWKKQTPDIDQVKLEVIDIWHFGLSMLLVNNTSATMIEEQLSSALKKELADDFLESVELFAGDVLVSKTFCIAKFTRMLTASGMSFDELYTGYVGKNVLNFFRQDHGYKEGTYHKLWGGKEDNEHLVELVNTIDTSANDFKEELYAALDSRYQTLCL
jgi:dimeric dUTPase (all-alpha-NTP-PPase superfamily)